MMVARYSILDLMIFVNLFYLHFENANLSRILIIKKAIKAHAIIRNGPASSKKFYPSYPAFSNF